MKKYIKKPFPSVANATASAVPVSRIDAPDQSPISLGPRRLTDAETGVRLRCADRDLTLEPAKPYQTSFGKHRLQPVGYALEPESQYEESCTYTHEKHERERERRDS